MRTGACVAGSALVLTPVVLTGCGSGGGARSVEAVTEAAAMTSEQRSEHMTIDATITTNGRVSTIKGSGDFRNRPLRGRMAVDAGVVGAGDISIDEIVTGSHAYLSSDGFFGELPPWAEWLAVPYGKGASAFAVSTASATSQTPRQSLAQLKAAGTAKKIGRETVGDVQTTHYAVTVDPAKVPAELVRSAHPRYGTIDVWVDGRGLVRQEMLEVSETVDGAHVTASMKLDFSRFGERVSVRTPSRNQAFDETEPRLNAILNGES